MATLLPKLLLLGLIGGIGYVVFSCMYRPPLEPQDPNFWWGPNELKGKVDDSIQPFKIKFEEQAIKDLKFRLKNHRPFRPPLEGVGFEYGFNSGQLDGWIKYWAEEYNFAEREKFLNQFPQFKTWIQGLNIHFIRVKPQVEAGVKVVPLLLLHGWPGSVREFYESIPLLTRKNPGYDFVFEVIVPALPGYGFSDGAVRPGMGAVQMGVVFRNLMHRLGHKQFYIQGGDWGSAIGSAMSTLYPEDVLGFHVNFAMAQTTCGTLRTLIGSVFPSLIVESHLYDRMYPLSKTFAYLMEETGYSHIQATKPDTLGVSISDSPAGLLAYILEKFSSWTNYDNKLKTDGGLSLYFTKDQLIDNLMFYWIPNSFTTSVRLYAETLSAKSRAYDINSHSTPVPTWALQAKHEMIYQPPSILRTKFTNLLNATVIDDGGHFIAFEKPKFFTEDVFKAVKAFIEFHQNNKKTEL